MARVYPKKNLGQHFLKDRETARRIAGSLTGEGYESVLEIGPGTGILTTFLLERNFPDLRVIEIDNESLHYLQENFRDLRNIIAGDFLKYDLETSFPGKLAIIGNLPYNISSQILFRVLDNRDKVAEVVAMLQKEVALRICSQPGSRAYGILSVLIQAWYSAEFLFSVSNTLFSPPPKVQSGVIRLRRNDRQKPDCDEKLFVKVVKAGFNKRRKTLRNSLSYSFNLVNEDNPVLNLRPEQLSVEDFAALTNWVAANSE
ncbi:MAG: 16S rRNA (adenine(1518)-N(6)/adenine(1519)-N(6))-dimethyltransferase RsmA [Bacteroidales bacterium]|jgi:16S rRNA (adenine1518-N6/adenine1519-N6)-dimethyltransferase|nr:16S rRNA (adenine(1518)-N(6)/adenine(1519)-N(6))-dimethyltransferase RsmA [Bacteroidales bacterium]